MRLTLFDFSNTHVFHRKALLSAINYINSKCPPSQSITVVVGTRNIIRVLPEYLLSEGKFILIFTGFGRLFTNYGFAGRLLFNLVIRSLSRKRILGFIVENSDDALYLQRISNIKVYETYGSGLNSSGFYFRKKITSQKLNIGYLSRFDKSKGSTEILKIAEELPDHCQLYIAGWDISSNKFGSLFSKIASEKSNVHYFKKLNSRKEVSDFFNSIDVFLCPSLREGGCISIQESVWHHVPFVTTNVPGCQQLADRFECPAYDMKYFAEEVLKNLSVFKELGTRGWKNKLSCYTVDSVRGEFIKILEDITAELRSKKR